MWTKSPKLTIVSTSQAMSFLLLTGDLLSSPWVARRQCLYPAKHIQYRWSIFLNLLKVPLIPCLIYCSSGPEHHRVFHIMSSIFRSTYARWAPHFQKCFMIVGVWVSQPGYKLQDHEKCLVAVPTGVPWPWPSTAPRAQHTVVSALSCALVSVGRKPGSKAWKDPGRVQVTEP